MSRTGGTYLYCHHCKGFRTCKVADYKSAKEWTGEYEQRWSNTEHPDIRWFRRVRQCLACDRLFTTAEINEDLLSELAALRGRVETLRKKIEIHKAAATSASDTVDQLSAALDAIADVEPIKLAI